MDGSNVFVADCSAMAIVPGIHTSSMAYAIAEYAADVLKDLY